MEITALVLFPQITLLVGLLLVGVCVVAQVTPYSAPATDQVSLIHLSPYFVVTASTKDQ